MNKLAYVLLVAYPLIYSYLARTDRLSYTFIPLLILAIFFIYKAFTDFKTRIYIYLVISIIALSIAAPFTGFNSFKLLPLVISLMYFFMFLFSNFAPVSFIESLVLKDSNDSPELRTYLKNLNKVWTIILTINVIFHILALNASMEIWLLYTTFLSYLLFGATFLLEFLYRYTRRRGNG